MLAPSGTGMERAVSPTMRAPKRKSKARRRASLDSGRDLLERASLYYNQRKSDKSSVESPRKESSTNNRGKPRAQSPTKGSPTKLVSSKTKKSGVEVLVPAGVTSATETAAIKMGKKQRRRHSTLGSVPIHNDEEDTETIHSRSSSNSRNGSMSLRARSNTKTPSPRKLRPTQLNRHSASPVPSPRKARKSNSKRSEPRSLSLQMKAGILSATSAIKSPVKTVNMQRELRESSSLFSGLQTTPYNHRQTGNPNSLLRKSQSAMSLLGSSSYDKNNRSNNASPSKQRDGTIPGKNHLVMMGRRSSLGSNPNMQHDPNSDRDVRPQRPQRPSSAERSPGAPPPSPYPTQQRSKDSFASSHSASSSSSSMLDHIFNSNSKFAARKTSKGGSRHGRRSSLSHGTSNGHSKAGLSGVSSILSANEAPSSPSKRPKGKKSRRHSMEGRVPSGSLDPAGNMGESSGNRSFGSSFGSLGNSSFGSIGSLGSLGRSKTKRSEKNHDDYSVGSTGSSSRSSPSRKSSGSSVGSNGSTSGSSCLGAGSGSLLWRNNTSISNKGKLMESLLTTKSKSGSDHGTSSKLHKPNKYLTSHTNNSAVGVMDDDEDCTETEDILLPLESSNHNTTNSKGMSLDDSLSASISSYRQFLSNASSSHNSFASDAVNSSQTHNKSVSSFSSHSSFHKAGNNSSSLEDSSSLSQSSSGLKNFMLVASSSYNSTAGETVSTATSTLSSQSHSISGGGRSTALRPSLSSSQSSSCSSSGSRLKTTGSMGGKKHHSDHTPSSTTVTAATSTAAPPSRGHNRVTMIRRVKSVRDFFSQEAESSQPMIDTAMELDPIVTASPKSSNTDTVSSSDIHSTPSKSPSQGTTPTVASSDQESSPQSEPQQPQEQQQEAPVVRKRYHRRNTLNMMTSLSSPENEIDHNHPRSKSSDDHRGRYSSGMQKYELTPPVRVVSTYSGNGNLLRTQPPATVCSPLPSKDSGDMLVDDVLSCSGTPGSSIDDDTRTPSPARKKKGGDSSKKKTKKSRKNSIKESNSPKKEKKSKKEKKAKRKKKSKRGNREDPETSSGSVILLDCTDISEDESSCTDYEYMTDNENLLSELDECSCTSYDDYSESPSHVNIISPVPSVPAG